MSTQDRICHWTDEIARLKNAIADAQAAGEEVDEYLYIDLHEAEEELNFAWQDDEEEENYRREQQWEEENGLAYV